MDTSLIAADTAQALTSLTRLFSSFNEEQINQVPFEGSWTAGQLAKHVLMSGYGFVQLIKGPVTKTERRPDEMVERFQTDLSDMSKKMKSPEFIEPPDQKYNKEELLNSLDDVKVKTQEAISTLDLTKTCTGFQLPGLGFLTRLESVYFVIYHTQRHTHQLKTIYEKVAEKQ